MRRLPSLPLALLLCGAAALVFGSEVRAQSSAACDGERATCRDTCNIEFGTSVTKQVQLRRCLEGCQSTHARCSERYRDLRSADITPVPSQPAPERMYEPPPAPLPEVDAASTSDTAPPAYVEPSTRTRYTDPTLEPVPPAQDSPAPAPSAPPPSRVVDADYNEGISLPSDEELGLVPAAAPATAEKKAQAEKPAAKRVEEKPAARKKASHPELPPEPEYDISD